jgi:hypothetical protein
MVIADFNSTIRQMDDSYQELLDAEVDKYDEKLMRFREDLLNYTSHDELQAAKADIMRDFSDSFRRQQPDYTYMLLLLVAAAVVGGIWWSRRQKEAERKGLISKGYKHPGQIDVEYDTESSEDLEDLRQDRHVRQLHNKARADRLSKAREQLRRDADAK